MIGKSRDQDGFALILTLFVLLLISLALAMLATAVGLEETKAQRVGGTIALDAVSDAALANALALLAQERPRPTLSRELHGGRFEIEMDVRRRQAWVTTRAFVGGRRRVVRALVSRTGGRPRVVSWRESSVEFESR